MQMQICRNFIRKNCVTLFFYGLAVAYAPSRYFCSLDSLSTPCENFRKALNCLQTVGFDGFQDC